MVIFVLSVVMFIACGMVKHIRKKIIWFLIQKKPGVFFSKWKGDELMIIHVKNGFPSSIKKNNGNKILQSNYKNSKFLNHSPVFHAFSSRTSNLPLVCAYVVSINITGN